jgi:hypothetical protein
MKEKDYLDRYSDEDLERLHRELWRWLAESGEGKKDWPEWEEEHQEILDNESGCFACAYCSKHDLTCKDCPIQWPNVPENLEDEEERCAESLYCDWLETDHLMPDERKPNADKIRDLPWIMTAAMTTEEP